jgi:integrase
MYHPRASFVLLSFNAIFDASPPLQGRQPRLGSMIVQDYIRPAAIAAGVIAEDCPRFGFHNLRHGLSTFLIDNGHDPIVVQRMLRQSRVDMTMHYVHNSRQARNAQGQFLERFLPNGGSGITIEEESADQRVLVRVQ